MKNQSSPFGSVRLEKIKMKIFLSILALLVVSACAGELKPKPLNYIPHQTYVYEYTGTVLTGIPSSSSLYSGTQLKADVQICQLTDQKWGFYVLQLENVTFSSLIDEVTDPAKAIFNRRETVEKQNLDLLKLKLQYSINNETQHLEYIEVHQDDKPWSLNIKKAIIEMFLVDIAGKQLKLNPDYEHSLTKRSQDEVHHSFDVYEPTSKGSCETMYQVNHALPASVSGLPGLEQFYWKVIKTRNYQNCTTTPRLTQHNWERKGCAEYCKQALILGQTKMNNYYSAEKSQCSCDDIEVEPLDQQSTSTYYIECKEYPSIWSGQSNSKVVFDNHGTRFVSYTNQTLQFNRRVNYQLNRLNSNYVVRVQNLTFSLYPYVGSVAQVLSHEIPIYNLMVPSVSQSALVESTVQLLNQVAVTIMKEDEGKNQRKVADLMQQIVSRLAHLDSKYIMKIYNEKCIVPQDKLYTNTLNSVRRQLFLDAISHVGTRNVSLWLEQVLDLTPESNGLFPIEVRQVVETLPLNVYAPTTSLIELLERKIYSYITEKDWDSLSAFVVAYGKLIAKACPSTEVYPELDNEISSDESRVRSNDWWIPENEKCTLQKTTKYIVSLSEKLMEIQSIRGKVLIAQALAHTGKTLALENLEAYVKGEFKCPAFEFSGVPDSVSDCTFFRTSVIYALHHMIPVAPKRIRSLVLPIFNDKTESYELRLAAFTVFMSAGPKRHELDSVAVSLQKETSLQVIYMVRSILEETANLTQACHQPLAQAAREIVATLPEVNLDGVYSQASYNEWYSTDKSTGFFANGQFVANNISYIPRHGYLSLGSHWKSLSNSWFTVAFQQKGLETALKNLDAIALSTFMADPKTIDDLYKDLGVESRKEEDFMLKLFVRVHEQTSLFTMDIRTLINAYHQFKITFRKIVSDASANQVGFNWVRFYMPSTYTDIVPSAIGLPIAALKQNNQIVSLKLTKSDSETDSTFELRSGNINLKVTPQIFTTSHASLSVFNQGIKSESDYGVYTSKKFDLYVPLNLNFAWKFDGKFYDFDYAIKPVFDKTNFHSSNNNFAFIANSNIASAHPIRERKMIQSLVPAYNYPLVQLKSPAIGMNLNLKLSTERPWFVDFTQIPSDGTVAWLLEKYNEMNQFNNNVTLTLVQNEDYPSTGIVGSFSSEQDISGDFAHIMGETQRDSYTETTKTERIVKELTRLYPSRINDPAFYAQSIDIYFATLGKSEPITFNSTLTLARAIDYHAYWYRLNSTLDNKNTAIWTRVPQRLVIDGKLERPSFPSHLVWELRNPENIVGDYIANISWSSDLSSEQFDTKILVNGQLKRSVPDPVIPEMQRKSWFHRQCEKDIKNGNASNHACERVFDQEAYFNVVTGKIEFMEVEEPVRESIRMVYSELKRSLIYYWRPWSTISYKKVEGEQNVVNFEAAYSNIIYERPVISLTVDTPTEKVNFSKIFVPVAPFPAMHPKEYLKASSLPKDQICTIMKDSVRTFDNITYNTYLEECETVVAMDCAADSQQFAVTVKGKAGERSIRVYTPLKTYFQIWEVKKDSASLTFFDINGNKQADYVLRPGKPGVHLEHLPISRYHEAHQIFIHNGVVNVVLPKENVRIAFDGQYVQITTSPLYVGKTCGLCGNQNQEFTSEFLDPKMVDLESDIEAFRRSYSLRNCTDGGLCPGGNCHLLTSLVHQRRPKFQSTWKSVEKVSKTPFHKTLVIQRENEACFSKYPVKVCRNGEKATKTESQSIDMVCLEKNGHPLYQKWIEEAEKRVIFEVSQLTATETLTYDVPVECVSDKESVRGI